MTNTPNDEIVTAAERIVAAAKKELNKTLDYSTNSLNDLEALIQYVKKHFLNLKREGKLTEQTIQRASVSVGAYLGEVVRRSYGGTWIAKNDVIKVLIINGHEFSPILYIFQRLTKDVDYSLGKYLSDINEKLQPQEQIENNPPILEIPKTTATNLTGNRGLIIGVVIGLAVFYILGIFSTTIYANATRISPTITPHPTATRIPATSTPSLIISGPMNYLQNLPGGYIVNDSIKSKDVTLDDGTRLFDIALINRQASNQGDLLTAQYFITSYPSDLKAVSGYYKYLISLETNEKAVLDSEIKIEGTDDSAMYLSYQDNNVFLGQYISRVGNVMVATVGTTVFDAQTITESYLEGVMADVAEIHRLGIFNTR